VLTYNIDEYELSMTFKV